VPRRLGSWRVGVFALVLIGSLAGSGIYVGLAVKRAHGSAPPPGVRVVTGASLAPDPAPVRVKARRRTLQAVSLRATRGPQLVFRNVISDQSFGKVAVAPLSNPNGTRAVASLKCDRVYYAGGRGLCLTALGFWPKITYAAKIFDANFTVLKQIPLSGIPSRARISADGRYGATTVFVNGDSYAAGNFSTRTNIIDMRSGQIVANLEKFSVMRNGERFSNTNFNFWGVTFARDDDHFYATLGSGPNTYLVAGSIGKRSMRVIYNHVECPSLSPDGTRIAFKRSVNSHGSWRLYVLDLGTMREAPLAEPNSVDDQVEWLDNKRILYWSHNIIWVLPADGTGRPQTFVSDAFSPAVVRTP
jgi:dipeptidyl aminopeptidase/acylaminoacyl peptidase